MSEWNLWTRCITRSQGPVEFRNCIFLCSRANYRVTKPRVCIHTHTHDPSRLHARSNRVTRPTLHIATGAARPHVDAAKYTDDPADSVDPAKHLRTCCHPCSSLSQARFEDALSSRRWTWKDVIFKRSWRSSTVRRDHVFYRVYHVICNRNSYSIT